MLNTEQEEFGTAGVRDNGKVEFAVIRTGRNWYDLLHLLEEIVVMGNNFALQKRAVNHWDDIREKLRGQGF